MAEKSTTVISLPQMVDLALNSPEVGIVNFTVLHSLLHVIVNQLDLEECNVEFRGSDSERLQNYISTAKPGPIITLTEYTIGPDGKGRKKKRSGRRGSKRTSLDEKGKKDENQKEKEIAIIKKEEDPNAKEAESSGSFQTIVVVEPASKDKLGDSPKFTIGLTKENLAKLQKDIKDLQKQVKELTELPGNIGLIDALRSSKDGSTSPLLDMFQILTLVKRLDATEVAMNKLASMMEDLAKEQSNMAQGGGARVSFKRESLGVDELVTKSQELRKSLDDTMGGSNQLQEIMAHIRELEKKMDQLEEMVAGGVGGGSRVSFEDAEKQTKKRKKPMPKKDDGDDDEGGQNTENVMPEGEVDFAEIDLSALPPREAITLLQRELLTMKEYQLSNDAGLQALKEVEHLKETLMGSENTKNMPPDVKLGQMDLRIGELKEQVSTLDTVYHQQFSNMNDKMSQLDKEIAAVWERINLGLPGGDGGSDSNSNLQEIYNKLLQLQEDMNSLGETADKLITEREGRQAALDVMLEQIELLKTVKADKEDLEDALADKADACQINRKVSHEQFDAAYEEITKALEEALDKLKRQEDLWIQSLNDLQKEIGNKLDKMELTPLKDFINSKLKGIQDKVKRISQLRQENEAAGAKSKILRNLNCLSCDAEVVMKKQTDITLFPKPYAMPQPKSPGPYLAYELDLLRKQQKSLPNSKNLNVFESALQTGRSKTSDKDHLCNRYCGGSHTVTTPQQRVMRVGHFMEQWGPEIAPVNDVLIKGTDGHLYKGRDDAMLRSLANEKGPTPRVENPPIVITECNAQKEAKDQKSDVKVGSVHSGMAQAALPSKSEVRDSVTRPRTSVEKKSLEGSTGKSTELLKRLSTKSAELKPN